MTTSNLQQTAREQEFVWKQKIASILHDRICVVPVCGIVVEYVIQPQTWDLTDEQTREVATAVSPDVLVTRFPLIKSNSKSWESWTWLRPTRPLYPGDSISMLFDIPPALNNKNIPFRIGTGVSTIREVHKFRFHEFHCDDVYCVYQNKFKTSSIELFRENPPTIKDLKRIDMRRDDECVTINITNGEESKLVKIVQGIEEVRFPAFGIYMSKHANPIGWRITIVNNPW